MNPVPNMSPESAVRDEIGRLQRQLQVSTEALDAAADAGDGERVSELQREILAVGPLLASANRRLQVHIEKARTERGVKRLEEISEAAAKIEKALTDDVQLIAKVDASLQALICDLTAMIGKERSLATGEAFNALSQGLPMERRLDAARLLHHVNGNDRLLLDYVGDIIKRTLYPQNKSDSLTIPSLPKIYKDRAEKLAPSVRWWRKTAEEHLK